MYIYIYIYIYYRQLVDLQRYVHIYDIIAAAKQQGASFAVLASAEVCWRMLTYADVCWRMQPLNNKAHRFQYSHPQVNGVFSQIPMMPGSKNKKIQKIHKKFSHLQSRRRLLAYQYGSQVQKRKKKKRAVSWNTILAYASTRRILSPIPKMLVSNLN